MSSTAETTSPAVFLDRDDTLIRDVDKVDRLTLPGASRQFVYPKLIVARATGRVLKTMNDVLRLRPSGSTKT